MMRDKIVWWELGFFSKNINYFKKYEASLQVYYFETKSLLKNQKLDENSLSNAWISTCFTGSSGGLGTSIKNLAVGLLAAGCTLFAFGIWTKGRQYFDDAGICIQQIKM
jgi:hypothetical protein